MRSARLDATSGIVFGVKKKDEDENGNGSGG